MKNVFKYLTLLAAVAFCALSCQTVPPDNSHVDPAADAAAHPIPALSINVTVTADDAATVSVTAEGPAAYISILVDENDEDQTALIDPAKLYAGAYESVAGVVSKYDANNPASLDLSDLEPNTVYQVYAVTASTSGVVGDVVSAHFLTTDTEAPVADIEGFMTKDNQVLVQFSEAVTYDESKPATAQYFAANLIDIDPNSGEILDPGLIGDAHVEVETDEDGYALFTVTLDGEKPLPDGAFYTVSYPAGAFKDAVGNECEAFNSAPGIDLEAGEWAPSNADYVEGSELPENGLGGALENASFDLIDDDAEKTVAFMADDGFTFSIPEGIDIFGNTKKAFASMTVLRTKGSVKSETVYSLEYGVDWFFVSASQLALYKPAVFDLAPGDILTLTIEAESIEDIYGNTNESISHSYSVSYGYTLADITGTYTFAGNAKWAGPQADTKVVIAPSDDEDADLMIYDLFKETTCLDDLADSFGLPAAYGFVPSEFTKFYADFDVDLGILTVYGAKIGTFLGGQVGVYAISQASEDQSFTFAVPAAGNAELQDEVIMYVNHNQVGIWDRVQSGTLTRTSADYSYVEPGADPAPDPEPTSVLPKSKGNRIPTDFIKTEPKANK